MIDSFDLLFVPANAKAVSPLRSATALRKNPMKEFISEIRRALAATLVLAVVCCGLYPLIVFGIAQTAFPSKANGSLIVDKNGTVRGSTLLAQGFTADKYFHPRPSAAGHGY